MTPEEAEEIVKDHVEKELRKLMKVVLFKIREQIRRKQWTAHYGVHTATVVDVVDLNAILDEYNDALDFKENETEHLNN